MEEPCRQTGLHLQDEGHRMEGHSQPFGDVLLVQQPVFTPQLIFWAGTGSMEKQGSHQAKRLREREREKKKRESKKHSWRLSGLNPCSLQRGGERQNKRRERRASQRRGGWKQQRRDAADQAGRAWGRTEIAALLWPGEKGRGTEPVLLRESVLCSACAMRTPTE